MGAFVLPSLVLAGSATITWQPNTEADLAKYRVYWSTTAGSYGTYKAEVPKGTTSQVADGLTEGQTYYFVVTAVDTAGNESGFSSPPASKAIPGGSTGVPVAPALSSPSNGASAPGTSLTFKWLAAEGATDYNIKIYTATGGLALDRWLGNTLTYTVSGFSNTGKSFSWVVTARNSVGQGPASARWTFVNGSGTTTPTAPPAPALSSPSNGASAPGTSLTFKWQAAQGATDYNIKIYSASGAIALDRWLGNVLTYTVNGFGNNGQSYSWTITARNSAGQGPASARWTFVNGGSSSTPTAPPAPVLSSPSNGGTASGNIITLNWQPAQGATDYNIKIYTAKGALAYDRWVGNTQSYKVYGFDNSGKTWFWTITARNQTGTGPASARWSFVNK